MADQAFLDIETLYQRYRLPIFRSVSGVVFDAAAAEDLTQETFEKAWRARLSYRGGPDEVAWWLYRIAMNEALSWLKRQRWGRRLALGTAAAAESGHERAGRPAGGEPADLALSVLSPKLRAVVVLTYLADLTPQEVAAALDIPRGTVATHLTRAKRLMREALTAAQPARLPGDEAANA